MHRLNRLHIILLICCVIGSGQYALSQLPSKQEILNTLINVNGNWINSHIDPGDWEWNRAAYFTGNMGLYSIYPDQQYLDYALIWAGNNGWGLKGGNTTRHADNQCIGQTYLDLYEIDPDPDRIESIQTSVAGMVNSDKKDDWWWIDAFYMAMPVFTRLGILNDDTAYFDKMYDLYFDTKYRRGLFDEDFGLWFRDENFDPPFTTPNGKNCYWSRGNGWVFGAHVRTLEYLPEDDPHRDEYISTFQAMAEALEDVQRTDGFWNVSLADPDDYGGPETSGTSFFTYGLAWGINNGLLDSATYYPVVEKAWHGLSTLAVHEDGFLGYVQNVGKEPESSQPVTYETTADFGVGAFLLAGTEVFRMAQGEWIDPPEPQENIALDGLAAYSGQQADNPAVNATDGNVLNRWSAQYFPQWIEIDLGDMYYLKHTEIVPYKNRAYQYLIYGKATPEDVYSVLIDRLENQDGGTILTDTINYGPVRYLKLTVTGCYEYTGDWVSIMEFKAYGEIYGLGFKQEKESPVRLFPNPASEYIDIEFRNLSGSTLQVEIIDLQGKPVYSSTWSNVLPGSIFRISEISKSKQGVYLIIITNGDQQLVKKLIIK